MNHDMDILKFLNEENNYLENLRFSDYAGMIIGDIAYIDHYILNINLYWQSLHALAAPMWLGPQFLRPFQMENTGVI